MKYIIAADKIGNPIEFNFGRRPRFQTVLGGILTIIAYGIIMLVAFSFIRSVFDTKEVEVSTSVEFTETYPEINLADSGIFPIIMMQSNEMNFVKSESLHKYITVVGVILELKFTDISTGNFK